MAEVDAAYASITELGRRFRDGSLSPVALTSHLLDRIETLNGPLHAYQQVTRERALAEAEAAEMTLRAGRDLGPLHGIPYAVKDLYGVAGQPTTAGTRFLDGNTAAEDCFVVRRLAQAGMVLLGKTYTVQFAFGGVGINHDHGTPHNPWHAEPHAPGGSSSGSGVAVAAGLAPMALGSDTGGSVRIPASLCGTVGLKTTVGRISRAGVYPLSWTLDSVGPLSRTVADAALAYDAMQGPDFADDTTVGVHPHDVLSSLRAGVQGLRLAFGETLFFEGADPEVEHAVRASGEVFSSLGAHVTSMEIPEVAEAMASERRALFIAAEACTYNGGLLDEHFDALDPVVVHRMIKGRELSAPDYFAELQRWRALRARAEERLRDVDAVICPATMIAPRPLAVIDADKDTYGAHNASYLRNTAVGNILNWCGVSLPCGFTAAGLPIGLMIYARPFREDVALRVAHAFEQATDWHQRRPELDWAG